MRRWCCAQPPVGRPHAVGRDALIAKAKGAGKTLYGEKNLAGLGVLYALEGKPEEYGLPADPSIPSAIFLWKDVLKPLGILGFWGSVAAVVLHYVTFGSRPLEENDEVKGGDAHG